MIRHNLFGLLISMFFLFGTAFCANVNVKLSNPSFENPIIEEGVSYKNAQDWQRTSYVDTQCPITRNPAAGEPVIPNNGENYLWYYDAGGIWAEIFQIPTNIESNTTYTCKIDVHKYDTIDGQFFLILSIRDEADPYNLQIAEAVRIDHSTFIPTNSWQTATIQFNSTFYPQWVGKPLAIRVLANGVAIDNVRLIKTAGSVAVLTVQGPSEASRSIEPGIGAYGYETGDVVKIKANRYEDNGSIYIFDHWVGGVDHPYEAETTIQMNGNKTIEAVYVPAMEADSWDVKADTWIATDALGRELISYEEAGSKREDKLVAIYYMSWMSSESAMLHEPYDNTKILAEYVDQGLPEPNWGPELKYHYWGEPELGYYHCMDDYAMRKHLYMLCNAGVDVLVLESTNGLVYSSQYLVLLEVLRDIEERGGKAPKICFWPHQTTVASIYNNIYQPGLFSDYWLFWDGRPLILPVSYDGSLVTLGEPYDSFFTYRPMWDHLYGENRWSAGFFWPQKYGWHHSADKAEQMAVTVARHATTDCGRSTTNPNSLPPYDSPPPLDAYHLTGTEDQGLFFQQQFDRAIEVDTNVVWIAEWNEWIALRFIYDSEATPNGTFLGEYMVDGQTYFVDQYNAEYSRDIEPMKDGFTDSYYYQLINNIRKFKGIRPPQTTSKHKTILIDGSFSEWSDVKPEYRDHIDDNLHRNEEPGWGHKSTYSNHTGRNDFKVLKVARDDSYVYFYAQTSDPLSSHTEPNWMLLFIDADQNNSTGWEGYDYLVNHQINSATSTTLKQTSSGWSWGIVNSNVSMAYAGNELELRIPRADIGQGSGLDDVKFNFHWADNIQSDDDIAEFAVSGDSAPDRRFMYRYDTTVSDKACQAVFDDGHGKNIDIDQDCDLDIDDLALLGLDWLSPYDFADMAELAEDWLVEYLPDELDATVLLEDDFEAGLGDNWPGAGWSIVSGIGGTTNVLECSRNDGDLISKDMDTSSASVIRISFIYKLNSNLDSADNIQVHYYDGDNYDNIYELSDIVTSDEKWDIWLRYEDTIYNSGDDSQYFKNNFRLKIEASGINGNIFHEEYMWIDDVMIIVY